jgi:P-type Ca2+ transporter type 2C
VCYMHEWYRVSWNVIIDRFGTDIYRGLTVKQVGTHREKYGVNKVELQQKNNIGKHIINLLKKPFTWLSFLYIGLLCYSGHIYSVAAMLFAVLIYFLFKQMLFSNSRKEMSAVNKIDKLMASVIRDGRSETISFEELVVGDIVFLQKGNLVPADLRIIESKNLMVKESAVTGEDSILEKYEAKLHDLDLTLSEMRNILFKNSIIIEGEATAVVIAVGTSTQVGKMLLQLQDAEKKENSIENKLNGAVQSVSTLLIAFIAAFCTVSLLIVEPGRYIIEVMTNILLFAMPWGVIFAVVIYYFFLRKRLRGKDYELRRVSLISTIADMQICAVDKIGAISERTVEVRELYFDGRISSFSELGIVKEFNVERMLQIGILCSSLEAEGKGRGFKGDMHDAALAQYAQNNLIVVDEVFKVYERCIELPYDKERKITTTVNKVEDKYRANIKGAPEALIQRCTHIMKDGFEKEITTEDIDKMKSAHMKMSSKGLSVTAFAYRNFTYQPSIDENIESNLVFAGLIAFENPLRDNIYKVLKAYKLKQIKINIFTDENKLSALELGKRLKLRISHNEVLSSIEINHADSDELKRAILKASIFSRLTPKDKEVIAATYKEKYKVTAMTGNNLADIEALSKCDVKISTGERCPAILKNYSDIYLKDNYLESLLEIINKSALSIDNTKKSILYTFYCILLQLFLVLIFAYNGLNPPLSVLQVTLINFVLMPLGVLALLLNSKDVQSLIYEELNITSRILFKGQGVKMIIISALAAFAITIFQKYINYSNETVFSSLFIIVIIVEFLPVVYYKLFKKK